MLLQEDFNFKLYPTSFPILQRHEKEQISEIACGFIAQKFKVDQPIPNSYDFVDSLFTNSSEQNFDSSPERIFSTETMQDLIDFYIDKAIKDNDRGFKRPLDEINQACNDGNLPNYVIEQFMGDFYNFNKKNFIYQALETNVWVNEILPERNNGRKHDLSLILKSCKDLINVNSDLKGAFELYQNQKKSFEVKTRRTFKTKLLM